MNSDVSEGTFCGSSLYGVPGDSGCHDPRGRNCKDEFMLLREGMNPSLMFPKLQRTVLRFHSPPHQFVKMPLQFSADAA